MEEGEGRGKRGGGRGEGRLDHPRAVFPNSSTDCSWDKDSQRALLMVFTNKVQAGLKGSKGVSVMTQNVYYMIKYTTTTLC